MGMFDNINCKYKLPLPEDPRELKDINFNELPYQTKDLENLMDLYEIREDGTLWVERHERKFVEGNPKAKSILDRMGHMESVKEWWEQRSNFYGSINFYERVSFHKYDYLKNNYWVGYTALFINGKVTEIKLTEFEAYDNSEERKNNEVFKAELAARKKLWDKWYMKYLYKHYDSFVFFLFRKYNRLKSFIGRKIPSCHKVENWFRPL